MRITELEEGGTENCDESEIVPISAKRVLVGAGARVLFYPTLLYNVIRNKIQAEFRWWDEVDQVVLCFLKFCFSSRSFSYADVQLYMCGRAEFYFRFCDNSRRQRVSFGSRAVFLMDLYLILFPIFVS